MKIFEGRYSWDGTKSNGREPVSWFPGAYDLVIAKVDPKNRNITYLRPYVCIFANTGKGNSVYAHPEKLAKRICEDFSLPFTKVLWVEQPEPGQNEYEIVVFAKKGRLKDQIFYSAERRAPNKGEFAID